MLEIIICAISGASIGSSIALIHETRKARKQQITTKKNELYMMMQDFNEFYDGYQEFFEQNLDEENFIKVLKKRNLITGEYAIVTFGDSKCQIPVYNSEKEISKCVNSLLNQSYTNFEICIAVS